MATVVKDEEACFGTGARKGASMYPWADWFDGRTWKLERGKDFTARTDCIAMTIYQRAHRMGGKVQIRKHLDTGIVYLRYTAPTKKRRKVSP